MTAITEMVAAEKTSAEKIDETKPDEGFKRIPNKSLAEFKRDTNMENVLIKGRWAVRGGISMHVSTTGTGKSVLQTQAALCFNRGVACCGLEPTKPFKAWVIQSEDDDDRVAIDRDDICEWLTAKYPGQDWSAAMAETRFFDFTGLTGVSFLEHLNNELKFEKPDAVIINPFNAFFGGDLNSGKDVSAFLKGGELGRRETEGLEAVLKRKKVWGWVFAHTAKPPTSRELRDWQNDPFGCAYKACGSSHLPDAVRSIMTFLKVPGTDDRFVFTAGKNGSGLRWRDPDGGMTYRRFFRWGDDCRHYWQDVDASEWTDLVSKLETGKGMRYAREKKPSPPPRDETPIVLKVFSNYKTVVRKGVAGDAVREAINADRRRSTPIVKDIGRDETIRLLERLDAEGKIRILDQGVKGKNGCMCGLPDVVERYLNPPLIEEPRPVEKALVPGSDAFEAAHDQGCAKPKNSKGKKGRKCSRKRAKGVS